MKNKNQPLVSVIVPTRNSAEFLDACLSSIKNQTYKNIEIIVVDNNSTDNTKEIAKKYTKNVFNKGPERSAQRNYGAKNAKGKYFLFIDSDMELTPKVVGDCVQKIQSDEKIKALIIPEKSVGIGFWAQCKALERSFYVGVDWLEAARFFEKNLFQKMGGFNENLISAEDWDLSQRVSTFGKKGRINNFIFHNEGRPSLIQTLSKKFYYAKFIKKYQIEQKKSSFFLKQSSIIDRYKLFFSQPKKLFKNPLVGIGMIFMKTCEFGFGGVGYIISKITIL
jgi:glycosyltransferase involved in cell wall biosynthesis